MILSKHLAELKPLKIWLLWKPKTNITNPNRIDKLPYSPNTLEIIKEPKGSKAYLELLNDYYYTEQEMKLNNDFKGLGLVMDNGLLGIDLDNCINENGTISDIAKDIIKTANTYTEYSPSKKGIRLFMYGSRPGTQQRKKINLPGLKEIEIYDSPNNNYLTITGDTILDLPLNKNNQEGINIIYKKYFQTETKTETTEIKTEITQYNQPQTINNYIPTDEEIIEKILENKIGFNLWTTTPQEHHSEEDLSLCNLIAFYSNKDKETINRIFKKSPLYREKWEREDYREMTINKAIKDLANVYTWNNEQSTPILNPQRKERENKLLTNKEKNKSLSSFIDCLEDEIKEYKQYSEKKTGFTNLDGFISLYPGLYTIGGSSGTGKTTFCLQLANQLAQRKERIIYFTLEQSKLDLVSKSLAYEISHQEQNKTINAIRIRKGETSETINQAKERYKKYCDYIDIVQTDFTCTIENIIEYIENDIKTGKEKPIIFIDYLQVIAPTDDRKTDKQIIEHIIKAIKNYQKEKGLIVFIISSVNRANYLLPTDLTSFKETGLIEFSSDLILGLDLQIVHDNKTFNTTGKEQEKRKLKNKAMTEYPRKICLVILKNRYGQAYGQFNFNYYTSQDRFTEDYSETKQYNFNDSIEI